MDEPDTRTNRQIRVKMQEAINMEIEKIKMNRAARLLFCCFCCSDTILFIPSEFVI